MFLNWIQLDWIKYLTTATVAANTTASSSSTAVSRVGGRSGFKIKISIVIKLKSYLIFHDNNIKLK